MLKPLSAVVGRKISSRPDIQEVKSGHKMDENKVFPETVTNAKIMNPSYDLTNTSTEQDGNFSSISPHHPPTPPLPDQGHHQAPAIGSAKQLSQATLSVPGPGSSPGHKLVRPAQPRMPRPPRPGMGRGRARPTGPRPAGSRGGMVFPGPRLSNPRSLALMRRSSSHPQSQYFPVSSRPAYSPQLEQFHSPSPCSSPILSNRDVSIVREVSPPIRQGWVPPPGLTMERVPATEPTQTISTLASILHQLGQVEGRRRLVKYKLTEEQIRALHTLGVGQEGGGGWQ